MPKIEQRTYLKVLTVVLLFTVSRMLAQEPLFNFHKLGIEEGLAVSNVFEVAQHENGLMYLTTQNGIYRYDGYRFEKLIIPGLKNNSVLGLTFRDKRTLIISIRDEGLGEYDLQTEKFSIPKQWKFKNRSDKFCLVGDRAYFLNTGIELFSVDLKTGELSPDVYKGKEDRNVPYCLFKTNSGIVLVGRKDGLYELKGKDQLRTDAAGKRQVHAITMAKNGNILLSAGGSIITLDGGKKINEFTPVFTDKVNSFLPGGERVIEKLIADDFGRYWITTTPGNNLYIIQAGKAFELLSRLDAQSTVINSLFKDNKENIWISTFTEGLIFIQNSPFLSLSFRFGEKNLNVNCLRVNDKFLLTGTNNGLYLYDLEKGESKVLSSPDDIIQEPIGNIISDGNDYYFASPATASKRPSLVAEKNYKFNLFPVRGKLLCSVGEKGFVVADNLGDVLLYRSVNSPDADTLISFPDYRTAINSFLRTGDSLLIATSNGLFVYTFSTHSYKRADSSNYSIADVSKINKRIYLAHEAGLSRMDDGELITRSGTKDFGNVRKILNYKDYVFLATNSGIIVCDTKLNPLRIINRANGLLSGSIQDIAISNGKIAIASNKGVTLADLSVILQEDPSPGAVAITQVLINGTKHSFLDSLIRLQSDDEDFRIQFVSPFYNKPNKQYFRYRINEGQWNELLDNTLQKPLEGGKYKIEIEASFDNINWSRPAVISVVKSEKYSENKWFPWLIGIVLFLIFSVISYLVIRVIRKRARTHLEAERQKSLLKHQAMNALLSPHFIFNSLTSIQNYINTNNPMKASEYLAKFSRLIRMIIEKASQSEITLQDELSRLNYYLELEKERFKNKFDFYIHVDPSINVSEVKIPNMIIQPHAENCIIHGILPKMEHGTLNIRFNKKGDKLEIVLEDDGIGLIKAKEHSKTGHKSLGTATIQNILDINSQLSGKKQSVSMVDKSTLTPAGNGTIITIELEL